MVARPRAASAFRQFSRSPSLELAAEKGLIELPTAIAKLKQTSFFISQEILDAALERDKARREKRM